jgi:hypothetical protein
MVKIVFESDASLRNYREKTKEIKVDAYMSACVSLRQPMSGGRPARGKVFIQQRTGFNSLKHWFLWIIATKMFLCSQT